MDKFIEHRLTESPVFVINLASLHNPHLIPSVLPRDLYRPIPLYEDRQVIHCTFAETFRANVTNKHAAKKGKRKQPDVGPDPAAPSSKRARTGQGKGRGRRMVVVEDSEESGVSSDDEEEEEEGSDIDPGGGGDAEGAFLQQEYTSRAGRARNVRVRDS